LRTLPQLNEKKCEIKNKWLSVHKLIRVSLLSLKSNNIAYGYWLMMYYNENLKTYFIKYDKKYNY